MNLKQYLDKHITACLRDVSGDSEARAHIAYAKSEQFGDYQANGVMGTAKKLKTNPRELAEKVLAKLNLDHILSRAEVAGPGFINLFISEAWLADSATSLTKDTLVTALPEAETVVIDYSSPNLAKEMHVGHLRGTCIGDAVSRVLDYLGYKVIRQNHFGDWGTQFGMLITYMLDLHITTENASSRLADLETFYREAKQRFDSDEEFAARARENVVRLQSGDEQCLALWQQFIDVSVEHCQAIYDRMHILLNAEHVVPESFYNDRLPGVISSLREKNLLTVDQGAGCVFLNEFKNKEGEPQAVIVQKKDGGFLYATTDLAAIDYRCRQLLAKRILYVVDARQSLHFQQVFTISRKAGFATEDCQLEHLSYGTLNGKDGKPFKTRSGETVKLADLLDESVERAYQVVREKNPSLPADTMQHVAEVVGIGALKYFELSKNRNSDYIFDWDAMLSFDGNTAPYLLYAYARIRSLFRKHASSSESIAAISVSVTTPEEKALTLKILQFTETVEQVAQDCLPNQLCLYLYDLAGEFMRFYEACPILKADDNIRDSRLALSQLTATTLRQGLNLLGIETLEQM